MKYAVLTLVFCLLSGFLFAESSDSSDSSVVFKALFLKNEMQSYDVTRTVYTKDGKDTTEMDRISFRADVYVTDSTASSYTLNWKISDYQINTGNVNLRKMMELAKAIEISYRITKPGVLMEFLTGKNVTNCLEEALPKMLAPYINRKDEIARGEVAKIYDLRENMETLLLRFIVQFHQAYGLGYNLGEVVSVPTEVNSRFSPVSIPATTLKKLVNYDPINHIAVLSSATVMDKQKFTKAVTDYTKADSATLASLDQSNMGGIVIDLKTGWVIWSFDQREAQVGSKIYGELIDIQNK